MDAESETTDPGMVCPDCGAPVFRAIPGRTSIQEIRRFYESKGFDDVDDPDWIHPGSYCTKCDWGFVSDSFPPDARDPRGGKLVEVKVVDQSRSIGTISALRRVLPSLASRRPDELLTELRETGRIRVGRYFWGEAASVARRLEKAGLTVESNELPREVQIIDVIAKSWSWRGVTPVKVVDTNKFGNVIFTDTSNRFWHVRPEELSCEMIAETAEEYADLRKDEGFLRDWQMTALVDEAERELGPQPEERCFCLKRPSVMGGEFVIMNVGTIRQLGLLECAGVLAEKMKDVENPEQVDFRFVQ